VNPNQIVEATKAKLATASEHFKQELKKLRTGRAHPNMVDNVTVEAYGQQMPLKAVGSIVVPEAQLLQITPFDPNNLQAIAEAIRNDQALGLTPTDDGRVVRIQIPPLTIETREQMVKAVGQKVEDCMISARQIRHEAFHTGEQAEKNKTISKDDRFHLEKQIDELLAKQKTDVEALAKEKEQEIMTV
jgi:ribosome recycling factor